MDGGRRGDGGAVGGAGGVRGGGADGGKRGGMDGGRSGGADGGGAVGGAEGGPGLKEMSVKEMSVTPVPRSTAGSVGLKALSWYGFTKAGVASASLAAATQLAIGETLPRVLSSHLPKAQTPKCSSTGFRSAGNQSGGDCCYDSRSGCSQRCIRQGTGLSLRRRRRQGRSSPSSCAHSQQTMRMKVEPSPDRSDPGYALQGRRFYKISRDS